ncbi:MAG: hypothetical protein JNL28_05385 [Planctomycetes bacterium]|nr:hypothetical protein [Planctomycetota bacterium]
MNIGQIKLWAWAAASVLTIGLCWYVYDFWLKLPALEKGPDVAQVRESIEGVSPLRAQADKLLSYDQAKQVVALVDWTGAPPVLKPVEDVVVTPTAPKKTPVKDLVKVMSVTCDLSDPKGSFIALRYRPEAAVNNPYSLLRVGDHLSKPHNSIFIQAIDPSVVTFAFDDKEREVETLSCEEFDAKSKIVVIGPGGEVMQPSKSATIGRIEGEFRPGRTLIAGPNRYKLGTQDLAEFENDYTRILGSEVQTAQHRDPRTGKYDGIEIKSVQPGSIAARHGATEGDVVKSINGHAVNTTQEAITFVKNNKDKYSTWEVVIENRGKTRTVTYESGN